MLEALLSHAALVDYPQMAPNRQITRNYCIYFFFVFASCSSVLLYYCHYNHYYYSY